MKRLRFTILSCILMLFGICTEIVSAEGSGEHHYNYQIIAEYPHDTANFTQGLFISAGLLYEGTGRLRESTLQLKTVGGDLLQNIELPHELYGEGIAAIGNRIYQLTWKNRIVLTWDKISLTRTGSLPYPIEGWGLTTNGSELIASNGSSTLYFFDPDTFQITRKIQVQSAGGPVRLLNELEYIDNEIWANIWQNNRIVRINPLTGRVAGWLDFSELATPYTKKCEECVLNGIAYDHEQKRLFITGKYWPKLFEIQVTEEKNVPAVSVKN